MRSRARRAVEDEFDSGKLMINIVNHIDALRYSRNETHLKRALAELLLYSLKSVSIFIELA